MTGKVYLVGAGPGDPELLTLKALRLLKTADAVLHDDLVSREILECIPPSAKIFNVGKRCGLKRTSQEEINSLMVRLALSGERVVRLKGGDSLIFGRAGEEIEALRQAGVEYEIVPGVTAALAAASSLGISLTDRRNAPSLTLLTGHRAETAASANWKSFTPQETTLAIYMPGWDYAASTEELSIAGISEDTPCAVVSCATTRDERAVVTTVRDLKFQPPLPSPSVLLVGEVVRFATSQPTADRALELLAGSHLPPSFHEFRLEEKVG